MPNSHFTGTFKAHGDPDEITAGWAAFVGQAFVGSVITEAVLTTIVAVSAPSADGGGEDYDANIAIPNFTPQPGVTYDLKYSDDNGATYISVGYETLPGTTMNFPNGYHVGRIFSVFGNGQEGAPSIPLP